MKKIIVFTFLACVAIGPIHAQWAKRLFQGLKGVWTVIETVGTIEDIYSWFSSEPDKASLTFTTDSYSPVNVYVNGKFLGQVSAYQSLACSLSPGDVSVSATAGDGTKWSHSYRLGEGAQQTVPFNGSSYDRSFRWIGEYGRFPEASQRHLSYSELDGMSNWDLRIMRNEIFARRGYIFHISKEMQYYFDAQSWYRQVPKLTEDGEYMINYIFTDVEKENIRKIAEEEKSRR